MTLRTDRRGVPAYHGIMLFGLRTVRLFATATLLLCGFGTVTAHAQSSGYSNVIMTAPLVDAVDENAVSMLTGQVHFSIPAVKLGDVSFGPYTTNEQFDPGLPGGVGGTADNNYGHIILCDSVNGNSYSTTTDCVSAQATLQAVYGEERAPFQLGSNGQYTTVVFDGSTFVDNGSTCTWTKRDGTKIVFSAFHVAGNPVCQSHNILQVIHPDGRIATYYYYGSFSTALSYTPSPIISIATNSGYLLKYNYSGTPAWGAETGVTAINCAYEACNPASTSWTPTNSWPTATLSWVDKVPSSPDNFIWAEGLADQNHHIFTLTDEAHRQHVFELDSIYRVISYQPPEATSPTVTYSLCSLLNDGKSLVNCFGYTTWVPAPYGVFDPVPLLFDLVSSSTRFYLTTPTGTWTYNWNFGTASPPGWSTWQHSVNRPTSPATGMLASGNSTPGLENFYGPLDNITHFDGTIDHFERSLRNYFLQRLTPAGVTTNYLADITTGNLGQISKIPVGGTASSAINEYANYPAPSTCASIAMCYKPAALIDANGNETDFTYDPTHGGVLTETGPAVNVTVNGQVTVARPQTRYSYRQLSASYLSSSGVMTSDPNQIFVVATKSFCRASSAVTPPAVPPANGCQGGDEVVTTYEYGTGSGPDNLIPRGESTTADGQTLRKCYGHDRLGNKIWETSPNANRSSCPDY